MTIEYLGDWSIPVIVPMHCTGPDAIQKMQAALGSCVLIRHAGDSIDL